MHPDIDDAQKLFGIKLDALEAAAIKAEDDLARLRKLVKSKLAKGKHSKSDHKLTDVVLLGSFARQEITEKSDFDFFVLQSGASPEFTHELLKAVAEARADLSYEPPGSQEVFGGVVIAANLYETIGLDSDSNKNMTQRILLLTESVSTQNPNVRNGVIKKILKRYCSDYLSIKKSKNEKAKVPRYLLNDLVRFWRTMAVDFGSKRWRSDDNMHLRLAKLRISRKILFAGPLATLLLVPNRVKKSSGVEGYLRKNLNKPPLAQLASVAKKLNEHSRESLKRLLVNYDEFVGIIGSEKRKTLKNPGSNPKKFNRLDARNHELSTQIQSSLEEIFFRDPLFSKNVQKYGLF